MLVIAAVAAAAWRPYRQRPQVRVTSHEELEDLAIAEGFNRVATWPQMRFLRWYVARRALTLVAQGTAVDLGCGPGHLVFLLARQAPGLHVVGVDLSDTMFAAATVAAQQAGLGHRVDFRLGDVAHIPFPDQSVDLVVSTLSLHHWSHPVAVLNEVVRVLRPGGAYLIFDLRRDLAFPLWTLLWFATRVIVPAALRRANEPLGSRNAAYTPPELMALAAQSQLTAWRVVRGPLWLILEGRVWQNAT
jgi:ubiquinone/menaquinone biosynthesis C-methylase UbiE